MIGGTGVNRMTTSQVVRLAGLAAILAGVLRAFASFAPANALDAQRQFLYGLTDTFIILGMVGAYSWRHKDTGVLGFCGFLLAVVGLGNWTAIYAVRALIFAAGLNLFGAAGEAVPCRAGFSRPGSIDGHRPHRVFCPARRPSVLHSGADIRCRLCGLGRMWNKPR